MEEQTWGSVFKDKAFIISLLITVQFFGLVLFFSSKPSQMDPEAKMIILQTYVIAFTAAWGFWLGSAYLSNKQKEKPVEKIEPKE